MSIGFKERTTSAEEKLKNSELSHESQINELKQKLKIAENEVASRSKEVILSEKVEELSAKLKEMTERCKKMELKLRELPDMSAEGTHCQPLLEEEEEEQQDEVSKREDTENQTYSSKFLLEFATKSFLGAGSYGVVFESVNCLDLTQYAVKRIFVAKKWGDVEKALNEVRTMAQLDHPGIVRYHSSWLESPPEGWQARVDEDISGNVGSGFTDYPKIPIEDPSAMFIYIQMQMCSCSLEWWLECSWLDMKTLRLAGLRDIPRMKSWFKQVVAAVEYIHSAGLIHRDLKPSNILIAGEDHLKICDLGIAIQRPEDDMARMSLEERMNLKSRASDAWDRYLPSFVKHYEFRNKQSNNGTGTPLYMAPEQTFWSCDTKADVFSLGLIFAEMCIPMSMEDREKLFQLIRKQDFSENIVCAETTEFIKLLTQMESEKRPTSTEIMNHIFLSK